MVSLHPVRAPQADVKSARCEVSAFYLTLSICLQALMQETAFYGLFQTVLNAKSPSNPPGTSELAATILNPLDLHHPPRTQA